MRVLLAAADSRFAGAVRAALRSDALVVEVVAEAAGALERAVAHPYMVLIVDLALPGGRGVEILARLRRQQVMAPILAVTAEMAPEARIAAMRYGADDCLTPPVLMEELVARVHALARRMGRSSGDCLEIEDLVLHCTRRRAFRAGEALPLTAREFKALECLVRAQGQPVSAATLLAAVWRGPRAPQENFVPVLMMRIRQKVDGGHRLKIVRTVRGVGYAVSLQSGAGG